LRLGGFAGEVCRLSPSGWPYVAANRIAAEARKALHSTAKDAWYSAIDGHLTAESVETARARTTLADRRELIERARRELSASPRVKAAAQPFLHALTGLLGDPSKKEAEYLYNGNPYKLTVERSPDPKAAGQFREQRAIAPDASVVRVAGALRRLDGGKPIEFRLWIAEGSPRPLRIEYQPKAYLRLTFEAQV